MRCEFCGTELILIQGTSPQTNQAITCPRCGRPLGFGSWLCAKCGYFSPENSQKVRELQTKQKFLQDDLKTKVPGLANILSADEYVYYCHYDLTYFQAVTENRFLINARESKGLRMGDWVLQEAPWSEVAAVGDLQNRQNIMGDRWAEFEVQTFKGPIVCKNDWRAAARLRQEAKHALGLHNAGARDIRAVIFSLNLEAVN
jgi:hypothetical protein